jgi:hypothetical protein
MPAACKWKKMKDEGSAEKKSSRGIEVPTQPTK